MCLQDESKTFLLTATTTRAARALAAEFALTIEKPAEAEQPPAPALAKSGSRKLLVRRKKPSPESAPAPYIEPPSPGQQALLAVALSPALQLHVVPDSGWNLEGPGY